MLPEWHMFNIPLIFYGEAPSENGTKINNHKTFSKSGRYSPGFIKIQLDQQNLRISVWVEKLLVHIPSKALIQMNLNVIYP